MYFILKTKYTLSLKFVPTQVHGDNHCSTSKLQLNIINYHTLYNDDVNSKQTGHINLGLFYTSNFGGVE